MMGYLSTHVLDVVHGRPAVGLRIELSRFVDGHPKLIASATTTADGRTDKPLLAGETMLAGEYRLLFYVGAYFASTATDGAREFLDLVPVDFTIRDTSASYHVPLLVSPWSYATYRGS
jgi:hydroxyisourate hydrolase